MVAYNLEELRPSAEQWHAAVARALKAHGIEVRVRADWSKDHQTLCGEPDLLLGQTCGYPLRNALKGRLAVVATPCYDAPGCLGSAYASLVVVRTNDSADTLEALRGRVCAFNSFDSHSGYNAMRALVAPLARAGRFFSRTVPTGAHVESLGCVARGDADTAAIDGVVWGLLERHRPRALDGLRVLMRSQSAPALPYVTPVANAQRGLDLLRKALLTAARDPSLSSVRADLLLQGFEVLDDAAYERIDRVEHSAIQAGYPALN